MWRKPFWSFLQEKKEPGKALTIRRKSCLVLLEEHGFFSRRKEQLAGSGPLSTFCRDRKLVKTLIDIEWSFRTEKSRRYQIWNLRRPAPARLHHRQRMLLNRGRLKKVANLLKKVANLL